MCQTYICRYKPYNRPPFGLNSLRSVALPHGWVHCSSAATTWIGWAAGGHELRSAGCTIFFYIYLRFLNAKRLFFIIDTRTIVCYNIFSATMNGRRLVLPIEDCDLWSQRNLLAEILMKGGLVLCWQLSCLFRSLACVLHALRLDTQ